MYWWAFLRGLFHCYSQKVISDVANESLIPYNLIQRAPETENLKYCNTECHPKPDKKSMKYRSVFRTKYFTPHKFKQLKYVQNNLIQCLKKWLLIQCIRRLSKFN